MEEVALRSSHSDDTDLDDYKNPVETLENQNPSHNYFVFLRSKPEKVMEGQQGSIHPESPMTMSVVIRNPFKIDHIMERLLRRVNVCHLKKLRKLGMEWNHLSIKELEKRASKLQMNPICITREMDLHSFLEDTNAISRLFTSFQFLFPRCLQFRNFYSLSKHYNIKFIGLKIRDDSQITINDYVNVHIFLSRAAPNLEEIEIIPFCEEFKFPGYHNVQFEVPSFDIIEKCQGQPVFPKLTKFSVDGRHSLGRDELMEFFKFILDKNRIVDPSPSLTCLEIMPFNDNLYNIIGLEDPITPTAIIRWTHLTHLKIESGYYQEKLTSVLVLLSEVGMSLQLLALDITEPTEEVHPDLVCSNYSRLFQMQSKSLKILKLRYFNGEGYSNEEEMFNAKITLPVFDNVHTLKLNVISCGPGRLARSIFEMGPFRVHFPKLETLKVFNHQVLESIMDFPEDGAPIKSFPLKSLKVKILHLRSEYFEGWKAAFGSKFTSVETLKCQGRILENEPEKEIPWKESIRVLEINSVQNPLKIAYLKNLRELVLIEDDLEEPEEYLAHFDQVLKLKLSSITFKFKSRMPSDEVKSRFVEHFPFSVNFVKI